MSKEPRAPINTWDAEFVRDVSVTVYRDRLNAPSGGGEGAAERMIEKDEDQGQMLRNRAHAYDVLTRAYLSALGFQPSRPNDRLLLGGPSGN